MEIKSNDLSTFDAVYDKYAKKVYRVALSSSGNRQVAEDITQSVFMKLYQHMNNINMDKVEAWLMVVTKHAVIDYMRKHSHEESVGNIEVFMAGYADGIDQSVVLIEDLEENYVKKLTVKERAELVHRIYSDLYRKDKRWHEAITTTYILERPQQEVAETMGISLGALQLILYRARKWIRKEYQKQFEHLDKI